MNTEKRHRIARRRNEMCHRLRSGWQVSIQDSIYSNVRPLGIIFAKGRSMAMLNLLKRTFGTRSKTAVGSQQDPGWQPLLLREGSLERSQITGICEPSDVGGSARSMPRPKFEKLLVPFDFSPASARLLVCATEIAKRTGAGVRVIHVVPSAPMTEFRQPPGIAENQERVKVARAQLSQVLRRICPLPGVSGTVLMGRPADEITAFARERKIDLILMSADSQRTRQQPGGSSTTERVTRRAVCPVLIAPKNVIQRGEPQITSFPDSCKRILVPVSFSQESIVALRFAAALAERQNADLCVLHFSEEQPGSKGATWRRDQETARRRLKEWIDSSLEFSGEVKPIVRQAQLSVYILLREASVLGADLLVFGPRDYSFAKRFRLSSSTDTILRHAPCPVLGVRAGAPGAG